MNATLNVGISSKNDIFELAALEFGKTAVTLEFPATETGVEAIKAFLAGCEGPLRLAVAGAGALSLALALGHAQQREVAVVSAGVSNQAVSLAHYARHI